MSEELWDRGQGIPGRGNSVLRMECESFYSMPRNFKQFSYLEWLVERMAEDKAEKGIRIYEYNMKGLIRQFEKFGLKGQEPAFEGL